MTINFKIVTTTEVPDILNMMEAFNAIDHYQFNLQKTKENLLLLLANEQLGRIWVIQSDEVIIGYMVLAFGFSFEYGGRDAFIDELYLKPEFRQQGIGTLAMDFVEAQALNLGIKVLHLELEQHNEGGAKLYSQKGFRHNGRLLLSKRITASP